MSVAAPRAAPPRPRAALLRAALAAAARGWHVFPCAPGGKQPALRGNWQELATTSAGQVREWWRRAPYNVGIACGPSGLVVIDLDRPRDMTAEDDEGTLFPLSGADWLSRLARKHGAAYPAGTYVVDTPSGGCHLYFRAGPGAAGLDHGGAAVDSRARVRNSAGALGPHIDVRGDGGYVVGAGSRTGRGAYTARAGGRLAPAPLPAWLGRLAVEPAPPPGVPAPTPPRAGPAGTDRAQGRAYALAALRAETERVAAARPGTRNDTLNRAAFSLGQLVAAGLLPPVPVITGLISAAGHAGLSEAEAERTIRSGLAGGARKPRSRYPE